MRTKKLSAKAAALQQVALFSACNPDQLELAAALVDQTRFPAGTTMARQGASGWEAFVIVSGQANVLIDGQHISVVGPGEAVGEMALLDRAPRSATVVAETDVEALVLTEPSLERLIKDTPVARNLLRSLARRLREFEAGVTV